MKVLSVLEFESKRQKDEGKTLTPGPLPEESSATLADLISREDPTKAS